MKHGKLIYRALCIIFAAALIAAFIVCCCKTQYGHDWQEMYRDSLIVVERCTICGEERFYNPY